MESSLTELHQAMHVSVAIEQCKQQLIAHYGDRFDRLILYGSMTRNEATADSDCVPPSPQLPGFLKKPGSLTHHPRPDAFLPH